MFTFSLMRRLLASLILFSSVTFAASRQHVIAFGRWASVKWFVSDEETQATDVRIRPLLVDGRVKEFTVGATHDVTETTFAVQRIYQLNDSLQQDPGPLRWRWQRGGWLLVDRVSGKVQALALPDFDGYYSTASWFRDYAAYCGISDDGKKLFAIVAKIGKRKPTLKKEIGEASVAKTPDSVCPTPVWQRAPSRVTFSPKDAQRFTYEMRGRSVEVASNDNDDAGDD